MKKDKIDMTSVKKLFSSSSFKEQNDFLDWMDDFLYGGIADGTDESPLRLAFYGLSEEERFELYDWVVDKLNPTEKESKND